MRSALNSDPCGGPQAGRDGRRPGRSDLRGHEAKGRNSDLSAKADREGRSRRRDCVLHAVGQVAEGRLGGRGRRGRASHSARHALARPSRLNDPFAAQLASPSNRFLVGISVVGKRPEANTSGTYGVFCHFWRTACPIRVIENARPLRRRRSPQQFIQPPPIFPVCRSLPR
jgi:hypothetical protein